MPRQIFRWLVRVLDAVAWRLGGIGMFVLLAMMLLTVADVFLRYAFHRPILGSTELTELMMTFVAFFAFVWCTLRKTHVKIELVTRHFGPVGQQYFDSISHLFGLGLCFLISWQSFLIAMDKRLTGHKSMLLDIPIYPFYLIIVIGCGMVGLLLLSNLVQIIAHRMKR